MQEEPILAKSPLGGKEVTLADHTRDVLAAVRALFGMPDGPTRLARQWLRFFGLGADDFVAFLLNLWVAAATHDLGKASSSFQRAVRRQGEQVIRHEHLSALLLWAEPFQGWLRACRSQGVDAEMVIAAVVAHHLKVNDKEFARPLVDVDADRLGVEVYSHAPDVATVLALAAEPLGVPPVDLSAMDGRWSFSGVIDPAREGLTATMYRFNRSLKSDEHRTRLLLAVKAALIVVDSAGSAVLRVGRDLDEWLGAAFDQPRLTETDIEDLVIGPRIAELAGQGRWQGFHDFQVAAAALGPRALLLSGCGSGKTLGAWKWIGAQLRNREASRAIFLYPTRATATEGFRDYVAWAGPEIGALAHGTAHYDLEGMFGNPSDPRSGRDYTVPERLFALGYWDRRIFSATVDAFLALISQRYAALCMLPLLVDSVIVFDEVHSFDDRMFRALERFLEFFDVPALCMTASLPQRRVTVLSEKCGLELFPREGQGLADLERQSKAPRYRVRTIDERGALEVAACALRARKRVLWVVNTVRRCQGVAKRLRKLIRDLDGTATVVCYHSRFRLVDRRERHKEAIGVFHGPARPAVLASTQVCEMSLDLDADVLISEVASVPAMIQRMGRCCREPIPSPGRVGEVYFYRPEGGRPYTTQEIGEGEEFARVLEARESVAHADLAEYLAQMPASDPFAVGGFTGFLDSGWYAMARDESFREDDEFTVDCVLDSDLDAYLQARKGRSGQAAGFIVPVPRRFAQPESALGKYLRLASSARYHECLGFLTTEGDNDE